MKFIIIIVFFFLSISSFSQHLEDEVTLFLNNKENYLFVQNHGYYFIDIPKEKNYQNRLSGTLNNIDTSKIDLNHINLNFSMNDYKYYLITDQKVILVLKSINHIKKQINK